MNTAESLQSFTVIGFRLDVDMTELLVAGVVPGPVADDVAILATSEEDFTRWALDFDAPDADTAASMAHEYCRTELDQN